MSALLPSLASVHTPSPPWRTRQLPMHDDDVASSTGRATWSAWVDSPQSFPLAGAEGIHQHEPVSPLHLHRDALLTAAGIATAASTATTDEGSTSGSDDSSASCTSTPSDTALLVIPLSAWERAYLSASLDHLDETPLKRHISHLLAASSPLPIYTTRFLVTDPSQQAVQQQPAPVLPIYTTRFLVHSGLYSRGHVQLVQCPLLAVTIANTSGQKPQYELHAVPVKTTTLNGVDELVGSPAKKGLLLQRVACPEAADDYSSILPLIADVGEPLTPAQSTFAVVKSNRFLLRTAVLPASMSHVGKDSVDWKGKKSVKDVHGQQMLEKRKHAESGDLRHLIKHLPLPELVNGAAMRKMRGKADPRVIIRADRGQMEVRHPDCDVQSTASSGDAPSSSFSSLGSHQLESGPQERQKRKKENRHHALLLPHTSYDTEVLGGTGWRVVRVVLLWTAWGSLSEREARQQRLKQWVLINNGGPAATESAEEDNDADDEHDDCDDMEDDEEDEEDNEDEEEEEEKEQEEKRSGKEEKKEGGKRRRKELRSPSDPRSDAGHAFMQWSGRQREAEAQLAATASAPPLAGAAGADAAHTPAAADPLQQLSAQLGDLSLSRSNPPSPPSPLALPNATVPSSSPPHPTPPLTGSDNSTAGVTSQRVVNDGRASQVADRFPAQLLTRLPQPGARDISTSALPAGSPSSHTSALRVHPTASSSSSRPFPPQSTLGLPAFSRFSTGSETPPSFSDDSKQPPSHSDLPNHLTPQEQLALAEEYARRHLMSDSAVSQNASLLTPQGTSGRSSSGADEAPYHPLQSPAPVPSPVFAYPGNAPPPPQDAGAVVPTRAVDIEANAAAASGGGARADRWRSGGGGGRGAGRRGTNGAGTADPNAAAAMLAEQLGEQGLRLRFARLEFGPAGEVMAPVVQAFSPIQWGAWAYYMALCTACLAFFFGPMSIIWWHYGTSPLYTDSFNLGAGIYSILIGLVIVWEEWLGLPLLGWVAAYLDVTVSRYNLRSILYIVLSSLLFLSYPTVVVGVCLIITALADRIACAQSETFWQNLTPPARSPRKVDLNAKAPRTHLQLFRQRMARWLEILLHLRDANRIGIVVWMSILLAGNILMFVYVLNVWINRVGASRQAAEAAGTDTALSYWIAPAKAFGLCLDLDLALILVPMCRTLIRWLYEYSTRDESYRSLALRGLLYLVPLDFHIHFHKLMGWFIIVCGVGHTLAHFVNFAQKPDVTLAVLGGPWALISGGLIIVLMFVMYSSTFEFVRRRSFDLFFSSHHLFVFLYVLLLVHGAHGEGPNFWKYFIGPATLYLLDRALRLYQGSKPVTVHSVQFMRDVMCIAFHKNGPFGSGVQCGQYILIQCPAVSSLQWHPFTISSAPGDPFVTVHIKMNTEKPSSWTYRVAAHLSLMRDFKPRLHWEMSQLSQEQKEALLKEEPNWEYIPMQHVEGSETKPGRVMGIDDRPMFRIDGPHAAPTQNLPRYDVALVVGAGIGSTPLAAALHYVVDQWALPLMETPVQPSCVSFVWVLKYENILSFRWLVGRIRETRMRVQTLRQQGRMSGRAWEMHIYVTSFPESRMQVEEDLARLDEEQIRQRHRKPQRRMMNPDEPALDPEDFALLRLLTDPPDESDSSAARWNRDPIVKEDIFVHSGRAVWPDMFGALANRHPGTDIGVMFCGLPDIAQPVRSECWKSNARPERRGTHFTFHGESF